MQSTIVLLSLCILRASFVSTFEYDADGSSEPCGGASSAPIGTPSSQEMSFNSTSEISNSTTEKSRNVTTNCQINNNSPEETGSLTVSNQQSPKYSGNETILQHKNETTIEQEFITATEESSTHHQSVENVTIAQSGKSSPTEPAPTNNQKPEMSIVKRSLLTALTDSIYDDDYTETTSEGVNLDESHGDDKNTTNSNNKTIEENQKVNSSQTEGGNTIGEQSGSPMVAGHAVIPVNREKSENSSSEEGSLMMNETTSFRPIVKRETKMDNLTTTSNETMGSNSSGNERIIPESETISGQEMKDFENSTQIGDVIIISEMSTQEPESDGEPSFWSWLFESAMPDAKLLPVDVEKPEVNPGNFDNPDENQNSTNSTEFLSLDSDKAEDKMQIITTEEYQAESPLPAEPNYTNDTVSNEEHYTQDENTTGSECTETNGSCLNETAGMSSAENETIEMQAAISTLENEISESGAAETTTAAIWNTANFINKTISDFRNLIKRAIDQTNENATENLNNDTQTTTNNKDVEIIDLTPSEIDRNITDLEFVLVVPGESESSLETEKSNKTLNNSNEMTAVIEITVDSETTEGSGVEGSGAGSFVH